MQFIYKKISFFDCSGKSGIIVALFFYTHTHTMTHQAKLNDAGPPTDIGELHFENKNEDLYIAREPDDVYCTMEEERKKGEKKEEPRCTSRNII